MLGARYLALTQDDSATTVSARQIEPGDTIPLADNTADQLDGTDERVQTVVRRAAARAGEHAHAKFCRKTFNGQGQAMTTLLDQIATMSSGLVDRQDVFAQLLTNMNTVLTSVDERQPELVGSLDGLKRSEYFRRKPNCPSLAQIMAGSNGAFGQTVQQLESVTGVGLRAPTSSRTSRQPSQFADAANQIGSYGSFISLYLCNFTLKAGDMEANIFGPTHSPVCSMMFLVKLIDVFVGIMLFLFKGDRRRSGSGTALALGSLESSFWWWDSAPPGIPKLWYNVRTSAYTAELANASGLSDTDPVYVAGVPAGRVDSIDLAGDHVASQLPLGQGPAFGKPEHGDCQAQDGPWQALPGDRAGRSRRPTPMRGSSRSPCTTVPYSLDDVSSDATTAATGVDLQGDGVHDEHPFAAAAPAAFAQNSEQIDQILIMSRELSDMAAAQTDSIVGTAANAQTIVRTLAMRKDALTQLVDNLTIIISKSPPLSSIVRTSSGAMTDNLSRTVYADFSYVGGIYEGSRSPSSESARRDGHVGGTSRNFCSSSDVDAQLRGTCPPTPRPMSNPSVISDRHIELGPAYTGGETLKDGDQIPIEPLWPDAFAGDGGNLGDLVSRGAAGWQGQGDQFNTAIRNSARQPELSGARSEDIGAPVDNLNTLMNALDARQVSLDELVGDLGTLGDQWANQNMDISQPLQDLQVVFDQLNSFHDNSRR
ncbi:unnamed protein product, partial [Mesorhabditis spiculigera]